MSRYRLALASALLLIGAASTSAQQPKERVVALDPARSSFGFEIRTRLGQKITGVFPRIEGEVVEQADGLHRVRLRMHAREVDIPGKPRYTTWMRSKEFFDAEHYPLVTFESEASSPQLAIEGGVVAGKLTIRGTTHSESMRLIPAECARAGYDCDVISKGTILRGRYGMNGWQVALGDKVTFLLHVRLVEMPQP